MVPADAGFDAADAVLTLPPTCSLTFNAIGGTLLAGDAACQVFGCAGTFTFAAKLAVWVPAIAIWRFRSLATFAAAGMNPS